MDTWAGAHDDGRVNRVKLLPEQVANQIAAGEVVEEREASGENVKSSEEAAAAELLEENSIVVVAHRQSLV